MDQQAVQQAPEEREAKKTLRQQLKKTLRALSSETMQQQSEQCMTRL